MKNRIHDKVNAMSRFETSLVSVNLYNKYKFLISKKRNQISLNSFKPEWIILVAKIGRVMVRTYVSSSSILMLMQTMTVMLAY